MKHLIIFFLLITSAFGYSQDVLAGWTFPSTQASNNIAAECGEFATTSGLFADGTNGSSLWDPAIANTLATFGGSTINTPLCSVTTTTQTISFIGGGSGNPSNGKSFVIKTSTAGYENITFSYASRGTSTGFSSQAWDYSFDETTWTPLTTFPVSTTTTFTLRTALNGTNNVFDNQASVYFRCTLTGASGTTGNGNNRFDNINISGTLIPLPLPTMSASTCDNTYAVAINDVIEAEPFTAATNYRFKFVKEDASEYIVERPATSIAPLNAIRVHEFAAALGANFDYDHIYAVSASAFVDGEWTDFGTSCDFLITNDPTTQLRSTSCNQTIADLGSNVYANFMPLATNWRFKVTRLSDNAEFIVNRNVSRFNLVTHAPSIANYGATYNVEVAFEYNNAFSNYGTICTITTPAASITLRSDFCPATLSALGSNIFAVAVVGAQEYTFEVTRPDNSVVEFVTPNRWFNLINAGVNPASATAYAIRVKVKLNDVYTAYGATCTVTTPGLPSIALRNDFCGATLVSNGSNIFANATAGATQYTFEITKPDNSFVEFSTSNRWFNLINAGVQPVASTTYAVRVKVVIGEEETAYGASCNVTTPGAMMLLNQNIGLESSNEIMAYPNPFNNQFTVKLADLSPATIQVFDINGRLVENQTTNDTFEVDMGQNLNAGVYLVRVEQNGESTSFKMIKK